MKNANRGTSDTSLPLSNKEDIAYEYYALSCQPNLSEIGSKRLGRILEMACNDDKLSLILTEIDEIMLEADTLYGFDDTHHYQAQRAKLAQLKKREIPTHKLIFERANLELSTYEQTLRSYCKLSELPVLSADDELQMEKILIDAYQDELLGMLIEVLHEEVIDKVRSTPELNQQSLQQSLIAQREIDQLRTKLANYPPPETIVQAPKETPSSARYGNLCSAIRTHVGLAITASVLLTIPLMPKLIAGLGFASGARQQVITQQQEHANTPARGLSLQRTNRTLAPSSSSATTPAPKEQTKVTTPSDELKPLTVEGKERSEHAVGEITLTEHSNQAAVPIEIPLPLDNSAVQFADVLSTEEALASSRTSNQNLQGINNGQISPDLAIVSPARNEATGTLERRIQLDTASEADSAQAALSASTSNVEESSFDNREGEAPPITDDTNESRLAKPTGSTLIDSVGFMALSELQNNVAVSSGNIENAEQGETEGSNSITEMSPARAETVFRSADDLAQREDNPPSTINRTIRNTPPEQAANANRIWPSSNEMLSTAALQPQRTNLVTAGMTAGLAIPESTDNSGAISVSQSTGVSEIENLRAGVSAEEGPEGVSELRNLRVSAIANEMPISNVSARESGIASQIADSTVPHQSQESIVTALGDPDSNTSQENAETIIGNSHNRRVNPQERRIAATPIAPETGITFETSLTRAERLSALFPQPISRELNDHHPTIEQATQPDQAGGDADQLVAAPAVTAESLIPEDLQRRSTTVSRRYPPEGSMTLDNGDLRFPLGREPETFLAASNNFIPEDYRASNIKSPEGTSHDEKPVPDFYDIYSGGTTLEADVGVEFATRSNPKLENVSESNNDQNRTKAPAITATATLPVSGSLDKDSYSARLTLLDDELVEASVAYVNGNSFTSGNEAKYTIAGLLNFDFGNLQIGGHYASTNFSGAKDTESYMGNFSILDFLGTGNSFGMHAGISPDVSLNESLSPLSIETYYEVKVSDFFTLTPAVIYTENSETNEETIYGAFRVGLSF